MRNLTLILCCVFFTYSWAGQDTTIADSDPENLIQNVRITHDAFPNWCADGFRDDLEIEDKDNYTIIIGGHFHGSSSNVSGFPAATLLGNLDKLRLLESSFIVCTGDMYMDYEKDAFNYTQSLNTKIGAPLFNAPGNHDIIDDSKAIFSALALGKVLHVFLDTEFDNGHISGDQLDFLSEQMNSQYNTLMIYSHRPIWSEEDSEMSGVFKDNTQSGTNFAADILPMLQVSDKIIYWFSGSLGGGAPASFFYHKQTENVTYINTGIRDLPRDGVIKADIVGEEVFFTAISLTQNEVLNIEEYNLKYWQANAGRNDKPFNYRLVPLYIKNMLKHRFFWYGAGLTLLGVGIVRFIIRRRKRH